MAARPVASRAGGDSNQRAALAARFTAPFAAPLLSNGPLHVPDTHAILARSPALAASDSCTSPVALGDSPAVAFSDRAASPPPSYMAVSIPPPMTLSGGAGPKVAHTFECAVYHRCDWRVASGFWSLVVKDFALQVIDCSGGISTGLLGFVFHI